MGVVVQAVHVGLRQRVAIKFLQTRAKAKQGQIDENRARFLREAQAASQIKSEHAAKVTDVGEMEGGSPYMVMEFLQGKDLDQVVSEQGPLPVETACRYLMQACEALAEAHRLGIIHRDIKPANLFLTTRADGDPIVKVLDFGIAKANDGILTQSSAGMGTLLYMPPEQLSNAKRVDARSDIWALGVTLFELLTRRTPFDAGNEDMVDMMQRIKAAAPAYTLRALRPDAPEALERIITACLQRLPDQRIDSVATLVAALAPFSPEQGAISVQRTRKILERSGSLPVVTQKKPANEDRTEIWTGPGIPSAERSGSLPTIPMYPLEAEPSRPSHAGGTQPAWGQTNPPAPTPARAKPSRGLLIGGGVALAASVGIGSFFLFTYVAASSPESPPSTANRASSASVPSSAVTVASASAPVPTASSTAPPVVSLTALPTVTTKPTTSPPAGGTKKAEPPKPQANCNPPYVLGADGKKKYKPECL